MPRLVAPTIAAGSLARAAQPTIDIDAGIRLRAWEPEDRGTAVTAFADPEIQRWHFLRLDSLVEADEWIAATRSGWQSETAATWAIADRERNTILGRITLYLRDLPSGLAEVSYWVVPEARGRRLAGQAVGAVAEWSFAEAGLHRIEIEHSMQNPASCRVAVRAGFMPEGVRRSALLHHDGWHDMHVHGRIAVPPQASR